MIHSIEWRGKKGKIRGIIAAKPALTGQINLMERDAGDHTARSEPQQQTRRMDKKNMPATTPAMTWGTTDRRALRSMTVEPPRKC